MKPLFARQNLRLYTVYVYRTLKHLLRTSAGRSSYHIRVDGIEKRDFPLRLSEKRQALGFRECTLEQTWVGVRYLALMLRQYLRPWLMVMSQQPRFSLYKIWLDLR